MSDTPKYAGMWDFDGACAPSGGGYIGQLTFSLGCFQWQPNARGGLKKGKVRHRVRGVSADPGPAYEAARTYCARKNAEAGTTAKEDSE